MSCDKSDKMNEEFRQKLIDLYKILIARSDITAAMDACDLMMREVKDFHEDYKQGKYTPILHAIIIANINTLQSRAG